MRQNLEAGRQRSVLRESAEIGLALTLAISGNQTLAAGMPYTLAYDPAGTSRNILMYTPTNTAVQHEHEIVNYGTSTGTLVIKAIDGTTTIGTLQPGSRAIVRYINSTLGWKVYKTTAGDSTAAAATFKQTYQQYTLLSTLANSQVMSLAIPFGFSLTAVGFRTRVVASTGGKAATLTAQVNGVSVTGGVVSLTTTNQNVSGGLTAGTAITAGGAGTATQTVGVVVSGVTAFSEGDGYVEYTVQNTDAQ